MLDKRHTFEFSATAALSVFLLTTLALTLFPFKEEERVIESLNLSYLEKKDSLQKNGFVGESEVQGETVLFYTTKTNEGGNLENYVPEKDSTIKNLKKRSESPTLVVYEISPENKFVKKVNSLFVAEKHRYEFNIHSDYYIEDYEK